MSVSEPYAFVMECDESPILVGECLASPCRLSGKSDSGDLVWGAVLSIPSELLVSRMASGTQESVFWRCVTLHHDLCGCTNFFYFFQTGQVHEFFYSTSQL